MQVSPSSSNESRPLSSSNSSAPPSTQHSQPVSGHEVTPVPEAKQEKETFFEKIRSLFCKNVSNKAAALESSQTPQSPVILKPVPSEFANSKPKVSSYNVREALNIVDESGALRKDWNRLAGITKEDKLKQEIPTSFVTDKARASYQLGQQPLQNLDNPNPQFESFLQEALNKPGMPK
ncbi:MAG: hypothetical protein JWO53_1201, partial [Chlamydiia bacterium]|nr:hypothetical protein [Chlamydiia bacterium]